MTTKLLNHWRLVFLGLALALAGSCHPRALEITGKVQTVSGDTVTIVTDGNVDPSVGDKIDIFFKIPGADEEISVGSGKVSAVNADSVEAKIENATGSVSTGQLVRIPFANPKSKRAKRSSASALTSTVPSAATPAPLAATSAPLAPTPSPPAATPASKKLTVPADWSANSKGRAPSFAFVDMNKIFKDYGKTKDAEAKINEAKNDAKKQYDKRADAYKKALDKINELNRELESSNLTAKSKAEIERDRNDKVTAIKQMEREINEWRAARERELQEQAVKMRDEIVAKITASINQLGGEANAILDVSGLSLSGYPLVVHYPAAADMSERATSSLNGGQSSPFSSAHNLKIALVNLNEVFKQLNKTKANEVQLNEGKNAAKKEYDEKAERYKKELADVPSSPGTARDQQVARVKEMERDITQWRAARERGLQEQALKMREEIVAEITKEIKARVAAEKMAVVLDISGLSLNYVPAIVCARQIPDLSNQVVTALNKTTGASRKAASSATAFASSTQLRFACVDMNRAFKAMPETKQAEAEINNLKQKAKTEMANADAKAREAKEKELQDITTKMREPITQKLTAGVREFAEAAGFNVIFDASGNSFNGVPVLVSKHDFPDLTDQLISQLTQSR